jgi:holo-[acyl-carrier protein] synthase
MIGIGIDEVEIERFRAIIRRRPQLLHRVFTDAERKSLTQRVDPIPGYAARFAAKEATMKAFGVGLGSVGLREIEVTRAQSGAPSLSLTGRAKVLASELGASRLLISMTHTAFAATAIVFVEGQP